ncbi:hypothetical protein ESCO_006638 [Escovopsis weberi]|uniref:Uncharacterized protein n=1 Tax=Escovopsis weberi TaxID=150374 RepID=A0A0M8N960_ESCWE|nr:hypothetical protein ESCO_006638 [Escovopsis weberi]
MDPAVQDGQGPIYVWDQNSQKLMAINMPMQHVQQLHHLQQLQNLQQLQKMHQMQQIQQMSQPVMTQGAP